jgi:hypothetical protein
MKLGSILSALAAAVALAAGVQAQVMGEFSPDGVQVIATKTDALKSRLEAEKKQLEKAKASNSERIKKIITNCTIGISGSVKFDGVPVNGKYSTVGLFNVIGSARLYTQRDKDVIEFYRAPFYRIPYWNRVMDERMITAILDTLESGIKKDRPHSCRYQAPK